MERSVIFAISASIAALILVLELVRRRRLREEYSLLWLAIAFAMLILSTWRELLHWVSRQVGIAYPPNLLFLMATLFILILLLYFSTVITRLSQENKDIAQEVALLRHEVAVLRAEHNRNEQHSSQSSTVT